MRIVVSKMACHSSLPNYVISKCVDDKINNIIRKAHYVSYFCGYSEFCFGPQLCETFWCDSLTTIKGLNFIQLRALPSLIIKPRWSNGSNFVRGRVGAQQLCSSEARCDSKRSTKSRLVINQMRRSQCPRCTHAKWSPRHAMRYQLPHSQSSLAD